MNNKNNPNLKTLLLEEIKDIMKDFDFVYNKKEYIRWKFKTFLAKKRKEEFQKVFLCDIDGKKYRVNTRYNEYGWDYIGWYYVFTIKSLENNSKLEIHRNKWKYLNLFFESNDGRTDLWKLEIDSFKTEISYENVDNFTDAIQEMKKAILNVKMKVEESLKKIEEREKPEKQQVEEKQDKLKNQFRSFIKKNLE